MWIGDVTKLLYQDEHWIPRNNQSIRVADMEDTHLANWLCWAENRAYDWFNRFFEFAPEYRRRFLSDAEFVDFASRPEAWIQETPLYRAILSELSKRATRAIQEGKNRQLLEEFAQALLTVGELEEAIVAAGLEDRCTDYSYDDFLIVYGS